MNGLEFTEVITKFKKEQQNDEMRLKAIESMKGDLLYILKGDFEPYDMKPITKKISEKLVEMGWRRL